ncbi:MAG: BlaI/MecI/CopY family transcriptional regulator [Armatimonadetes bacterium]|nr:BlaI/MecI/CopY family transcriptional regulator [Armatimonadota bacterium]
MSEIRDLPQAEYDVMDALWRRGEATIKEILADLSAHRKLAYTTVATLLGRLREKSYVEPYERNFAYVFRPLIQREQVQKRKLDDLVQRVFGGSLAPLATYLAENSNLNTEQIAALDEIVRSADKDGESHE